MKPKLILTFFIVVIISSKILAQTTMLPTPLMGNKMLKEFLKMHLVYPDSDLNNKKQGTVKIAFTTNVNGDVVSRLFISSVSNNIDAEALRLFRLIIWQTAFEYGIPVTGTNVFTVNFNIKKYAKTIKRRSYGIIETDYPTDTSYLIYKESQLDTLSKPKLPKGCNNLHAHVYKQMKYPQQAAELEIDGKVEISFIIEVNGLPSNFNVIKAVGGGCTNEAMRIINELRWQPGFKNGFAVRSKKTMFIEFKLSSILSGTHIPSQTNSGF